MASPKSVKTTASFAQRTQARLAKENVWQQFSSEAKYSSEMLNSLQELASQTFPGDDFNSASYMEAIVTSLAETISPEVGVKDFWMKMGAAGCQAVRIEEGHLNFYSGSGPRAKKMDITAFTQPIVFEAHSSFYKQRTLERKARVEAARAQLADLRKQIRP